MKVYQVGLFRLLRQTENIRNKVDFWNIGVDPVSHLAGEYLQKVKGKKAPLRNHDEKKDIKPTENIVIDKNIKSENKEDGQVKPEASNEYKFVEDDLKTNFIVETLKHGRNFKGENYDR